ncbi:MAG: pyridoxamine 5'-phosphate oxidase family protein [Halobacteriota archaeon]|uniref:pyridoxamine 5'-phosphate oxidase family protein n=1 Tax=Halanaeroarchaeum sp. HSR-CO TaxID=2866382 RepID=UPI00217EDC6A|nr:pyridoxamine 5'-phosphate oxidase family protein [Halanaeroarchaeum sp. HSR-CO]
MVNLPSKTGSEMSEEAIKSLLERKGHGVLSMGTENRGYGVPISYHYDADHHRIVVGMVKLPGSKRSTFASKTDEATMTVYEYHDVDTWESVIATGTLHQVRDADVPEDLAALFFYPEGPETDGQMVELDQFERAWYELRIEEISGRYDGERSPS